MNFFTPQIATVDLGDDNTVTVRKRTFGEDQKIISKCATADPLAKTSSVDIAGLRQEQLVVSIVEWSGPGFDGRTVTRENILALPTEIIDKIEAAIESINSAQDDSEKKA